jgi:hypothetical protein
VRCLARPAAKREWAITTHWQESYASRASCPRTVVSALAMPASRIFPRATTAAGVCSTAGSKTQARAQLRSEMSHSLVVLRHINAWRWLRPILDGLGSAH